MMALKFKILAIIILITAVMILGIKTAAVAGIQFILPLEGSVFGADYVFGQGPFKSYIGGAYEYSLGQSLYHYGARYTDGQITYGLNYGLWLNTNLPGYGFQEGLEGWMDYASDTGHHFKTGIFSGKVSRSSGEAVGTNYLVIHYSRQIYFDWEREWKLRLRGIAGQENAVDDGAYTVIMLEAPGKIKSFRFIPRLGSIQAAGPAQPCFDLMKYIRGYDREARTGTKLAAVTLEQRFPMFKKDEGGDSWASSLLMGSIFLDAGDVLIESRDWTELGFHYDAGFGLVMNLGSMEFRLDQVFVDTGEQKLIFWMTISE